MRFITRTTDVDNDKNAVLRVVGIKDIMVQYKAVLSIDGSTTNTGLSILRDGDGALLYSMSATREKDETPVRYKVGLKKEVYDILLRNTAIQTVYYEEPFIGKNAAASNLFMLRSFIEEIIIEHEPTFNYLKHIEVNNLKWKKIFLYPDKLPQGSELQKEAVRNKMLKYLPCISVVTQDEIESYAMGFACISQKLKGFEDNLESSKKPRPFQYNIVFIGADDDDDMLQEFHDTYTGPLHLLESGVVFNNIASRVNFDKKVHEAMGNDDKVIILKFKSNTHGNIVLQYRIGHLAENYSHIYAIIWRKSRK